MKLHRWVVRQRGERKQSLDSPRRKLLDDIHFDWKVPCKKSMEESNWNTNYVELKSFLLLQRDKGGKRCCKPSYIASHHSKTLGTWVTNQRKRYQQDALRDDRKHKLKLINFDFGSSGVRGKTAILEVPRPQDPNSEVRIGGDGNARRTNKIERKHQCRWDFMYEKLVQYKGCHGHTCVPYHYEEDPSLGMWVSTQRRVYNQKLWCSKNRSMESDRKEKLDSIGFVWDAKNATADARAAAKTSISSSTTKKRKKDGVEQDIEKKTKKSAPSKKSPSTTQSSSSSECHYVLYPEEAMGMSSSNGSSYGGSNRSSATRNELNDSPPNHRLIHQREEEERARQDQRQGQQRQQKQKQLHDQQQQPNAAPSVSTDPTRLEWVI